MKSKIFIRKDKPDLDRQIWNWRSANMNISVKKIHPIKNVPLRMHKPLVRFDKIELQDRVWVKVDYEALN